MPDTAFSGRITYAPHKSARGETFPAINPSVLVISKSSIGIVDNFASNEAPFQSQAFSETSPAQVKKAVPHQDFYNAFNSRQD